MHKIQKNQTQGQAVPTPRCIPTETFREEVFESKKPVLVVFWAPWSRACQVLDSALQKVAVEAGGKLKIIKVDADDGVDLSLWYDIQSIPTLLCFVEGTPRVRIVGTASKEAILSKLTPVLETTSGS